MGDSAGLREAFRPIVAGGVGMHLRNLGVIRCVCMVWQGERTTVVDISIVLSRIPTG